MITTKSTDSVFRELTDAIQKLKDNFFPIRMLETQFSIAYAASGALTPQEVVVFSEAQITTSSDKPISRMVLTAMRFDSTTRCIAVIRYSEEILAICQSLLLEICSFDRAREPPGISTIDWGVAFCCERSQGVPDIIYDMGCEGKDPLIRILGENPTLVSASLNRIITRIKYTNFIEE